MSNNQMRKHVSGPRTNVTHQVLHIRNNDSNLRNSLMTDSSIRHGHHQQIPSDDSRKFTSGSIDYRNYRQKAVNGQSQTGNQSYQSRMGVQNGKMAFS